MYKWLAWRDGFRLHNLDKLKPPPLCIEAADQRIQTLKDIHKKRLLELVENPSISLSFFFESQRPEFVRWGPVMAYCAFIFWLSSQSNLIWVSEVESVVLGASASPSSIMKHIMEYLILGTLTRRASSRTVSSFAFAGLYGVSDEIHQLFVPMRFFSIDDILANFAGALLGVLIWSSLELFMNHSTRQSLPSKKYETIIS